jgi:glycosyltransferase involved in cell wall biosynthesis
MSKLRILQVCSASAFGGGERHVLDLSRWLAARGHELHLAVRPRSAIASALAEDSGSKIKKHELALRGVADLASLRQLVRIMREERIDILHAHLARDYPLCGLAAKFIKVDFYLTRHHYHRLNGGLLYGWSISRVRHLIAVSESVGKGLTESFPRLAERVRVIPNWVDPTTIAVDERRVARARLGASRRLVAAVLGQLTPLKRQDLFLRAAAKLLDESPDCDLDLFVIGGQAPKDRAYAERLRQLAEELGLADRVHFPGYLAELSRLYSAFDVVVVPSENEAFSLVLVEAMTANCAVIASQVGGMAEIVSDGVTGMLVPPDDVDALYLKMRSLIGDDQLRRRLGEAAARDVHVRFARDRVLPRIEELYTQSR